MPGADGLPARDDLAADLRLVRGEGLARLRPAAVPCLVSAAGMAGFAASGPAAVEELIRAAVERLGGGDLQRSAELTFGTAHGRRGDPASVRRRLAAQVYNVSVERFRKAHERTIVDQVAAMILVLCAAVVRAPAPAGPSASGAAPAGGTSRWVTTLGTGPQGHRVTLHIGPLELLRDVDVIVSSANTYLQLSHTFRSSLSAALRVAAARWAPSGEIEDDVVQRELARWLADNRRLGVQVAPGTVAVTSAGELRHQGIHLIFHAAAMMPEGRGYRLDQSAICRTVRNVLAALPGTADRLPGGARSVCLPLFGAGCGAVSRQQSLTWLLTCLRHDLPATDAVEVHLLTRSGAGLDLAGWTEAAE